VIPDALSEETARVCEETARYVSGRRGVLRTLLNSADPEFSDAAFGLAADVADSVVIAIRATGMWPGQEAVWLTAAAMLRGGYKRGQRVVASAPGMSGTPS
jgi:hypothetical protein